MQRRTFDRAEGRHGESRADRVELERGDKAAPSDYAKSGLPFIQACELEFHAQGEIDCRADGLKALHGHSSGGIAEDRYNAVGAGCLRRGLQP